MTDKEGSFNEDLQQNEPCTTCLDIALDAAYSGGFSPFGEDVTKVGVDAEWDDDGGSLDGMPTIKDNDYD